MRNDLWLKTKGVYFIPSKAKTWDRSFFLLFITDVIATSPLYREPFGSQLFITVFLMMLALASLSLNPVPRGPQKWILSLAPYLAYLSVTLSKWIVLLIMCFTVFSGIIFLLEFGKWLLLCNYTLNLSLSNTGSF